MHNGDPPQPPGARLLTTTQAATIALLMGRMEVTPDNEGMRLAQAKVGGLPTPYGYLLLNRAQAKALIGLMVEYLKERASVPQERTVVHDG